MSLMSFSMSLNVLMTVCDVFSGSLDPVAAPSRWDPSRRDWNAALRRPSRRCKSFGWEKCCPTTPPWRTAACSGVQILGSWDNLGMKYWDDLGMKFWCLDFQMMMLVMMDQWISGSVASDSIPNLSTWSPNSWDDHCLDMFRLRSELCLELFVCQDWFVEAGPVVLHVVLSYREPKLQHILTGASEGGLCDQLESDCVWT